MDVLRISSSKIRKANKAQKAFGLFTLGSKLKKGLYRQYPQLNIDLIIGHSPPVTLSGLFGSLKRKYKAPVYYLLKDIWPQGPADLKFIRRNGIVFRFFRLHEKRTYRTVDFIGCMSPMNVAYILKHNSFLRAEKVEVCPNTIAPRRLGNAGSTYDIRTRFNIPEEARIFLFSGNLGRAHGLEFYLDAIEKLKESTQAFFLIGGSGQYYKYLKKEIHKRGLQNIALYSRLPANEFDHLLLSCDVGVVLLSSEYTVPQFPSRLLAYLEAGLPVFCAVNKDTDIGTIVEEAACGKSIIHGDLDAFIDTVAYFCHQDNAEAIGEMRLNAQALLHNSYSTAASYDIIMKHFTFESNQDSHDKH
jgi:glycosyltransferase involved in cell wall biosynthesis